MKKNEKERKRNVIVEKKENFNFIYVHREQQAITRIIGTFRTMPSFEHKMSSRTTTKIRRFLRPIYIEKIQ
jgi:hypothetical protein